MALILESLDVNAEKTLSFIIIEVSKSQNLFGWETITLTICTFLWNFIMK